MAVRCSVDMRVPGPSIAASVRAVRRLLIIVCGLFALEGSLYSALAPLLPHYADTLGL